MSDLGAVAFGAAASLTATVGTLTATALPSVTFSASAELALSAMTGETPIPPATFTASASLWAALPRSYGIDIFRPAYRVVLLSSATGEALAELDQAALGRVVDTLNSTGSFDFTLAARDAKAALCLPWLTEVQVWRGGQLEWWGVIVRAREDGGKVSVQCSGLLAWLTKRTIGRFPRENLLANGSFEGGLAGWSFGWLPGSVPEAPPDHALSSDSLTGARSLSISGSSAPVVTKVALGGDVAFEYNSSVLTSAGEAALDELCGKIGVPDPSMTVDGHTDSTGTTSYNYTLGLDRANSVKTYVLTKLPSASITVTSYGETRPVATNSTAAGRARNRRVEIGVSYTQSAYGNKQYAAQSLSYTNASAHRPAKLTLVGWYKVVSWVDPGIGYGAALETVAGDGTIIAAANVQLDAATPIHTWVRQECSVDVEPGATVQVSVRLHPPSGTVLWDSVWLTEDTVTAWYDTDQASIVAGLVQHAQDPALGKSDLRIGTRCPLTGRRRDRTYAWSERRPVLDAVTDFATIADGLDVGVEYPTPTSRVVATYYPRKGADTPYVLALGSNVLTYTRSIDGETLATTLAVQASSGSGSGREEGVYMDATPTGGVVLEAVYQAPSYTSVGVLDAQALEAWRRYSRASALPQPVMAPSFTSELLSTLTVGDRVRVIIPGGLVPTDGQYRIIGQSLDPVSDQITYTLAEEV